MEMGMKITIPWHARLLGMKSGSSYKRNWWMRKRHEQAQSTPLRSVIMKEDDLDHLGALHQVIEDHAKRWWRR